MADKKFKLTPNQKFNIYPPGSPLNPIRPANPLGPDVVDPPSPNPDPPPVPVPGPQPGPIFDPNLHPSQQWWQNYPKPSWFPNYGKTPGGVPGPGYGERPPGQNEHWWHWSIPWGSQ